MVTGVRASGLARKINFSYYKRGEIWKIILPSYFTLKIEAIILEHYNGQDSVINLHGHPSEDLKY
jgi:hypothetical protein